MSEEKKFVTRREGVRRAREQGIPLTIGRVNKDIKRRRPEPCGRYGPADIYEEPEFLRYAIERLRKPQVAAEKKSATRGSGAFQFQRGDRGRREKDTAFGSNVLGGWTPLHSATQRRSQRHRKDQAHVKYSNISPGSSLLQFHFKPRPTCRGPREARRQ